VTSDESLYTFLALRAFPVTMGTPAIHSDLVAWQEAMTLVERVYRDTDTFPQKEVFSLTAQIRRAAISVPSNLAEGAARNSRKEFLQFVGFSCGSLAELETQLQLAVRLGYLHSEAQCLGQLAQVGKLVRGLRRSLRLNDD
jgi:four helix bundle protein